MSQTRMSQFQPFTYYSYCLLLFVTERSLVGIDLVVSTAPCTLSSRRIGIHCMAREMPSSTKPELHNGSQRRQRRTELYTAIVNIRNEFGEVRPCGFYETCEQTNRHTYRNTLHRSRGRSNSSSNNSSSTETCAVA